MLKVSNLHVILGKRNILKGVSLSFLPGLHFVAGLNGSGKSTLLKAISCSIPFDGNITFKDQELSSLSENQRAAILAVVPQQFEVKFDISIEEFVLMGRFHKLSWLGNYSKEDFEISRAMMKDWGIFELAKRRISQLSGGELQRALIAKACCQESPVILLDEPDQSLDWKGKSELGQMLRKLESQNKILVCATHDKEILQTQGAKIIGIKDGRIVWDGTWSEDIGTVVFGMEEKSIS